MSTAEQPSNAFIFPEHIPTIIYHRDDLYDSRFTEPSSEVPFPEIHINPKQFLRVVEEYLDMFEKNLKVPTRTIAVLRNLKYVEGIEQATENNIFRHEAAHARLRIKPEVEAGNVHNEILELKPENSEDRFELEKLAKKLRIHLNFAMTLNEVYAILSESPTSLAENSAYLLKQTISLLNGPLGDGGKDNVIEHILSKLEQGYPLRPEERTWFANVSVALHDPILILNYYNSINHESTKNLQTRIQKFIDSVGEDVNTPLNQPTRNRMLDLVREKFYVERSSVQQLVLQATNLVSTITSNNKQYL